MMCMIVFISESMMSVQTDKSENERFCIKNNLGYKNTEIYRQ